MELEGVSNDVLMVCAVSVLILLWVFSQAKRYLENRISPIHPDSQDAIDTTREHLTNRPPRPTDSQTSACPVCLGDVVYGLETNCGHLFCGRCIVAYWRTGRWLGPVACPICRQTVTVLMTSFTREELQQQNSEEKNALLTDLYNYNRRFSGEPRTVWEYLQDLPAILRHAISDLFSVEGMVFIYRLRIAICLFLVVLYILSPLDIIPEMVLGFFGFIDDIFIMAIIAIYITMIYRTYLAERAAQPENAHID